MKKYNLKFHKGLGQNFLFDKYYLDKIVETYATRNVKQHFSHLATFEEI